MSVIIVVVVVIVQCLLPAEVLIPAPCQLNHIFKKVSDKIVLQFYTVKTMKCLLLLIRSTISAAFLSSISGGSKNSLVSSLLLAVLAMFCLLFVQYLQTLFYTDRWPFLVYFLVVQRYCLLTRQHVFTTATHAISLRDEVISRCNFRTWLRPQISATPNRNACTFLRNERRVWDEMPRGGVAAFHTVLQVRKSHV